MDDNANNDDKKLWDYVAKSINPINRDTIDKKSKHINKPKKSSKASNKSSIERHNVKPRDAKDKDNNNKTSSGLDKRTEMRLKRGQMPIDATLDLHGYSKDQAYSALINFIKNSYETGKRCVIIITGKGGRENGIKDPLRPKEGILKKSVPQWLSEP